MKKVLFSAVVAVCVLCSVTTFAQSVDEIIAKHIEAVGGADNWKKLQSMESDMNMKSMGADVSVKIRQVNKKAMRTDISVMGMNGYVIVTNNEGWNYMPFQGQAEPEAMGPEDVKAAQDGLEFTDDFITYKEKEKKLESLGTDNVDGAKYFKLRLTSKNGKESTYYIDPATYYVVKQEDKVNMNGKEINITRTFSNYQKLPEGIVYPMAMSSEQGEMQVKKIQFNTTLEDSVFKPDTK